MTDAPSITIEQIRKLRDECNQVLTASDRRDSQDTVAATVERLRRIETGGRNPSVDDAIELLACGGNAFNFNAAMARPHVAKLFAAAAAAGIGITNGCVCGGMLTLFGRDADGVERWQGVNLATCYGVSDAGRDA